MASPGISKGAFPSFSFSLSHPVTITRKSQARQESREAADPLGPFSSSRREPFFSPSPFLPSIFRPILSKRIRESQRCGRQFAHRSPRLLPFPSTALLTFFFPFPPPPPLPSTPAEEGIRIRKAFDSNGEFLSPFPPARNGFLSPPLPVFYAS